MPPVPAPAEPRPLQDALLPVARLESGPIVDLAESPRHDLMRELAPILAEDGIHNALALEECTFSFGLARSIVNREAKLFD